MSSQGSGVIGYSAYDTLEEVYEYIEDSCFIVDSLERLRAFTAQCWQRAEVYRPAAVTLADIERDFGVSNGRYVMESVALKRFRQAADARGLVYTIVEENAYGSPGLTLVRVDCRPT